MEAILVDLTWDDEENKSDKHCDEVTNDVGEGRENNDLNEEQLSDSSDNSLENLGSRARQPPTGMHDYVSGEGLSEEDETTNLVMFVENVPILFEIAQKNAKWRATMDAEIETNLVMFVENQTSQASDGHASNVGIRTRRAVIHKPMWFPERPSDEATWILATRSEPLDREATHAVGSGSIQRPMLLQPRHRWLIWTRSEPTTCPSI
ncbi:hypothetical protein V6N11_082956 [Hibiscus sabdariffa]|uniref:Uncharacterized protein n=1 Tax=Hibiscus sabdariffa TaxID=183260 RepID=A0ABR2QKE1_9ROSI